MTAILSAFPSPPLPLAVAKGGTGSTTATGSGIPGTYLVAPHVYAPVSQTNKGVNTTTMAAFDSTNVTTGSFNAPASGNVLVTLSGVAQSAIGAFIALGLTAHGTITPIVGSEVQWENWTGDPYSICVQFYVTGLTPAAATQFDLVGCVTSTDTFNIVAFAATSTTPTLGAGGVGAPIIMSVQAI